jgi:hypothetical protein
MAIPSTDGSCGFMISHQSGSLVGFPGRGVATRWGQLADTRVPMVDLGHAGLVVDCLADGLFRHLIVMPPELPDERRSSFAAFAAAAAGYTVIRSCSSAEAQRGSGVRDAGHGAR